MADLVKVKTWAAALIDLHLDASWSFAFDHAKKRAGLCDYTNRRISVSKHLAARYEDDEIHQVLLHEVAHALAGSRAGHGRSWKATATGLGYEGKRLHDGEIASELAPWTGRCAAGHIHYRYRQPTRPMACGLCSRRFDESHLIDWHRRVMTQR